MLHNSLAIQAFTDKYSFVNALESIAKFKKGTWAPAERNLGRGKILKQMCFCFATQSALYMNFLFDFIIKCCTAFEF